MKDIYELICIYPNLLRSVLEKVATRAIFTYF